MDGFRWSLRLPMVLAGLVALGACSSMNQSDRAMVDQARSDAQAAQAAADRAAQAAADRAAQAADRAAASANEAADAASTAQMAMERQQRMVQTTTRK
jgi:hypothetical protein